MAQHPRAKALLRRASHEGLGWLLVIGGIAMLPLPGPGIVVVAAGVAILAKHYSWAHRILAPVSAKAAIAARAAVDTRKRIALGFLAGLWFLGLGLVWIWGPRIPEVDLVIYRLGPQLPGNPWAVGLGLIVSATVYWVVLIWSIKHYRSGIGIVVKDGTGAA